MEAIKPKKTLVEETYKILVDAICSREFLPGERLNQDEIAARLNVSRQPVNSAIAILKADGLVEDTGRRGVVVSELDPALFHSIYEYRLTVEPFALGLACDRLPKGADREAAAVLKRGREAVGTGEMRALLRADKDFHTMIYGWSRNHVIQSSMGTNWHHIRRAMAEVLSERARLGTIWDEHEGIVEAVLHGSADVATGMMRDHIQSAYEANMRFVDGQ